MGKGTKQKNPNAPLGDHQQQPAAEAAAAVTPAPANKRVKATSKRLEQQQQQPQQVDINKPVHASTSRSATSKRPKQQLQQQQSKEDQQQSLANGEAAAAVEDPPQPKKARGSKTSAAGAKPAAEKPPYYLVKSEPHVFSIDDLEARPNQTEPWDGVRNAQARNLMQGMAVGDVALFYHSSCKVPGIVGIAQVVHEAYPDPTAFDSKSDYYDAKTNEDNPKWFMVDWKLVRKLKRQITLEELKSHKDGALEGMALFNRPRLSVQPVTEKQWEFIMSLEDHSVDEK